MKRNTTVLILCGLFVVADALVLDQTINGRAAFSTTGFSLTLFSAAIAAVGSVAIAVSILRKRFLRQKKPVKQAGYALARP